MATISLEKSLASGRVLRDFSGVEKRVGLMRPRDVLASDLAEEMVAEAQAESEKLFARKERWFGDVDAFVELVLGEFGVRLGGSRGGLTFLNHDKTKRVTVSVADQKTVNQAIIPAQALMNEILDDMLRDTGEDMRGIVDRAFARNQNTGRISLDRILGLKNLKLTHPRWPDAKAALTEAVQSIGSKTHLRFYTRKTDTDGWTYINLDFSSL